MNEKEKLMKNSPTKKNFIRQDFCLKIVSLKILK
jgi:hypothetical protein